MSLYALKSGKFNFEGVLAIMAGSSYDIIFKTLARPGVAWVAGTIVTSRRKQAHAGRMIRYWFKSLNDFVCNEMF
jgi:hypothetical protein